MGILGIDGKGSIRGRWIGLLAVILLAGCVAGQGFDLGTVMRQRPDDDRVVFDYVGVLADVSESTSVHLEMIRDRYRIEMLVAALPTLNRQYTVNEAAVEMFSNWRIGKADQGRGILLLLVDDVKEVKLEIGYALEDVFTDAFTGYIETAQLRPHFAAGTLETGLIAVMEELEARSQIKYRGDYDANTIGELDARYLSQGAGARIALNDGDPPAVFAGAVDQSYPAGRSPQEAWQTMIARWRNRERNPYIGVFTPTARLAYRDFTEMPDSRFDQEYRTYADKDFSIRQKGDYAVVYFGKRKGWQNAPFLLCRTPEGWQFDLVHQRRFVRMGPAPSWGIEFSEHPHMTLLMDAFRFNGQDIPLEGGDRYTIHRDGELADQILAAEAKVASAPGDFDAVMELARLYTIVSMSRKAIRLLKKAQQLNPADPRPHKYLAIAHVNGHYQYQSAQKALVQYVEQRPADPFGHNFLGYIYYRQKAYAEAIDAFQTALSLAPDNCYAHFYLAFAYAWRYEQASPIDPRRRHYQRRFRHHAARTRSYQAAHPLRVQRLDEWLQR